MGPNGVRAPAAAPRTAPSERAPDARMAAHGEDAEWFRRLPPHVQEEYRARWRAAAARGAERRAGRKLSVGRAALRGAVAFAVTQAMFGGSWVGLAVAPVVGAVLGLVWLLTRAGPLVHAATGGPLWFFLALAFQPDGNGQILLLFGFAFHAGLCSMLAQVAEWKRSDGEEQ